jgi:hypothetical protein
MICKCKVEQRRLTPGVFNLKQFLNGSETMVWEVDNCVINDGTCNLANYDAFLTLCVGGEIDEILLTKRQTGDVLQLVWNVGTYATALTGYVKYQITFRSANFDTLGVIADDPEANGVYTLTDQNATGDERIYSKAENGYSIKWDAENGRWALYQADGATVVDYQTTPSTEPHCGVWENIGVGNNEAAAWISDEAIMYVSETIAADQKVTGNYPTILRQLWKKIAKAGVTSVNGKVGIVELSPADIGAAEEQHQHEIKDVANLQETLDKKAQTTHTHKVAEVTDLQAELNKKADASHAHKITDTEGLQEALNGKAPTEHSHTISNVTGLQDALNNKAPASHSHSIADITNLQAELNDLDQTKAQTDLANVTNPVQAFKDMVITWSLPNYAAGVNYTSSYVAGVGWTAPDDGWCFTEHSDGSYDGIYCNGGVVSKTSGAHPHMLFPVKKGDSVTIRRLADPTVVYTDKPLLLVFYPNR